MRIRSNTRTMDMVHGPLLKNLLLFAIPLMLSNLLQIAFNAADTIVVGKFSGQDALAAVGATGPIVNMIVSLFQGIALGANIVIAQQIGAREEHRISDSVHTAYFLALAGGLVMTGAGLLITGPTLRLLGTPDNIIGLSALYMRIYFLGSIPVLVFNFGAAILRAKGDTARPTVFLALSGGLNVILNLVFVIGLKLSVTGVALATVISESSAAVMVTIALLREEGSLRLEPKKIRMDGQICRRILRIGVPTGVQSMMWAVSNMAVQASLNTFGSTVVAGNSAAQNIEGFTYVGMGAFSQGCITFTSQCTGAGERRRIRHLVLAVSALTSVMAFAVGALCYTFGPQLLTLYTNDTAVIEAGMVRMWYVVFWVWINGLLDVPACSARGMGHGTAPTVAMLIGIIAVRLVYLATVWRADPTLDVLYFCFPLSWVITTFLQFGLWVLAYRQLCRKLDMK